MQRDIAETQEVGPGVKGQGAEGGVDSLVISALGPEERDTAAAPTAAMLTEPLRREKGPVPKLKARHEKVGRDQQVLMQEQQQVLEEEQQQQGLDLCSSFLAAAQLLGPAPVAAAGASATVSGGGNGGASVPAREAAAAPARPAETRHAVAEAADRARVESAGRGQEVRLGHDLAVRDTSNVKEAAHQVMDLGRKLKVSGG
jgi:hypothetical protein